MPLLEQFVYGRSKNTPQEIGEFYFDYLPVDLLIATRPYLTTERLIGRRRRGSEQNPNVIVFSGLNFVIDGHHKVRRSIDIGEKEILCKILSTDNKRIGEKLLRSQHGYIHSLPISS
ncbi:hypothetical protein HYT02_04440 [Candidatus Gottesmanbacteria bacterium]|nr:hypothetical protein [Candidatus Gottesmanbacteria bacterium]